MGHSLSVYRRAIIVLHFLVLSSCYMQGSITELSSTFSGLTLQSLYNDEVTFSVDGGTSTSYTVSLNNGAQATGTGSGITLTGLMEDTTYTATVCLAGDSSACTTMTFKTLKTLTLSSVYPASGDWNSYVRNNGSTKYNATGVACDGTETGNYFHKLCLHGGELKKGTASSLVGVSCSTVSVTDLLNVFDWTCEASSGSATALSIGLKSNKGLMDLVTESGYISNRILLSQGGTKTHSTSKQNWWNNPVTPLPSGATALSSAGTIYVLGSSRTDGNHVISADQISVVVKSGNVLSTSSTSTLSAPNLVKFLWLEGAFQNSTGDALVLNEMQYSRLENITCDSLTSGYCLFKDMAVGGPIYNYVHRLNSKALTGAIYSNTMFVNAYNYYSEIYSTNSTYGVNLEGARSSRLDQYHGFKVGSHVDGGKALATISGFKLTNSTMDFGSFGIYIDASSGIYHNIRISNMTTQGIRGENAQTLASIYSNLLLVSNSENVRFWNSDYRITMLNVTSAGSPRAIQYWRDYNHTYVNHAYVNNTELMNITGNATTSANNNDYINMFISGTYNIPAQYARDLRFLDFLLSDASLSCTVSGLAGPNVGLANTTCANTGTTTATRITGLDISLSIKGLVTSDTKNAFENTSGQAGFSSLDSYSEMDSFWRAWGKTGSSFNDPAMRNACISGLTCQIWDWRLKSTDTVLRNTTGDGVSQNSAFVAGTICPTAIHGNRTATDKQSAPNTFLINAFEIIDDSIGDDDGLCESNEACIYSPNYGAYQGEGDYTAAGTCTFQNGTVTGVQMYAYPTNGI